MKNLKIFVTLLLVQIFYIGTIFLACIWDGTMFMALRVLAYLVWGGSLVYVSHCIKRYEPTKKNRQKGFVIYAIGCISVLTAQFISASDPTIIVALTFSVFLFIIYLVEVILIMDIRKTGFNQTILELEQNPNKELFTGITKEYSIRNHSLLVTALFFGLLFTIIGIPLLCSQDYFLGIKALIFLYAWDTAILIMRLYTIKAGFHRFILEIVFFHLSMMCLSLALSKFSWALEQTIFQLGCVLCLVPIVLGICRDIGKIRKEK